MPLRVSVPGAITGALLAESLATGKGLGFAVTQAASQLQYDTVWAMVWSPRSSRWCCIPWPRRWSAR